MSKSIGGLFTSKLSKQANLKLMKSNSTKFLLPTHSLIVRKLNSKEKSSNIITNEINEYLNSPEKFLSSNAKVIIGKKINVKDINFIGIEPLPQKKTITPNKRMSLYRKQFNFNNNNNNNNDSPSKNSTGFSHYNLKEKQQHSNNEKYEIIDNEQLKKIFNRYKTFHLASKNDEKKNNFPKLNEKNKNKNNNNSETFSFNTSTTKNTKTRNKELPFDVTQSLSFQYNKLKIRQNLDNKVKNISKRLSRILIKKESELLLNRIDDYSFKRELLRDIDFNKPIEDKYGVHKWNISLRRPKNFEGMRNSYINLTRDQNPFWGIVVEKCPKIKEAKIRPGFSDKNNNFFENFKRSHSWLIKSKEFKNYENLNKLCVKGENLFNIEYNREINNSRGKKLLHKTFVDKGGKVILKTEINNIFGEMTFCEDYNKNNLLNSKYTNFSSINSGYNTFTNKLPFQMRYYTNNSTNFKYFPNSSMMDSEILKKNTFTKSKSTIEL